MSEPVYLAWTPPERPNAVDYVASEAIENLIDQGYLRRVPPAGTAVVYDEPTLEGKATLRLGLAEGLVIRGQEYLLIPVTGG